MPENNEPEVELHGEAEPVADTEIVDNNSEIICGVYDKEVIS